MLNKMFGLTQNRLSKAVFLFFVGVFVLGAQSAQGAYAPAPSGNYTVSSSDQFAGNVDGVDNGNLIINSGATLTIRTGQTIVWNGGRTITQGGSIAFVGTGQLVQSNLWMFDNDADGWPSTTTQVASASSPGTGYVRRSSMASITTVDCNDNAYSTGNSCYSQAGYYSQAAYPPYVQASYLYTQASYESYYQGYYQGSYESYYQGYYQGLYESVYESNYYLQASYEPLYYPESDYYSQASYGGGDPCDDINTLSSPRVKLAKPSSFDTLFGSLYDFLSDPVPKVMAVCIQENVYQASYAP